MAGQLRGIQQRNGTFFARIVIPAELRPALGGKTELRERLGTDRKLAERDAHAVLARFHDKLTQARQGLAPAALPRPRPSTVEGIARTFYAEELDYDDRERVASSKLGAQPSDPSFRQHHVASLTKIASRRASDEETAAVIGWAIEAMAGRGAVHVTFGTPAWRELAHTLAAVQLEAIKRQDERDRGDFSGEPKLPALTREPTTISAPPDPRVLGPESLLPLAEIVARMHREKRTMRPATKTEQIVAARMFDEFTGEPLPIHKITRRMLLNFKEALASTPVLYAQRFPGKTLPEAIEANKRRKEPLPVLSPKTVNGKWLMHLKAVMNWAVANDIIPDNPAQGVSLDQGSNTADTGKLPFSSDDLARMAKSGTFEGELDERRWAVLAALYTGMRASELAQLRLDGIRSERGILLFTTDGELKNAGSRRIVPVHSALLARGLEQRVADLRARGETHLFPEWFARGQRLIVAAAERGKTIQQPYSLIHPKWFNRFFLPSIGMQDRRQTFHCFRHTAATAMSTAAVPREIIFAITGHADQSAGGRYIHGLSIEAMGDAIEKLRFDLR